MPQSDTFELVEAKIKSLERQLSLCDRAIAEYEQSGKEAEREVEAHFANCVKLLVEREMALLNEVSKKVTQQKKAILAVKKELEKSIQAYRQTLNAASLVNFMDTNFVEKLLQGLMEMKMTQLPDLRIKARLPSKFCDEIKLHGEVGESASFSIAGEVTTFAGSGTSGKVDGPNAKFNQPLGICLNLNDNSLYVCDFGNDEIRRVTMDGRVNTITQKKEVNGPSGIAIYHKENTIFVTNSRTHNITKFTANGAISCFAGSGIPGKVDGVGTNASFFCPYGICINQQTGDLFVVDQANHRICKISPKGDVTTLAGSTRGFSDGRGNKASFDYPRGICFDEHDRSLLVCDCLNHKLRRVQLNGEVSTICKIEYPTFVQIAVNTIIVSSSEQQIFKVTRKEATQNYKVELLAASGKSAKIDGKPEICAFRQPGGIAINEIDHSCFVADMFNHSIRKISFAHV